MRLAGTFLRLAVAACAVAALPASAQHVPPAGEPVAHENGTAHEGAAHAEEGAPDASAIFGGLFKHLEPHAVFALWLRGASAWWKPWEARGVTVVKPFAADAEGNALHHDAHDHPVLFESQAELDAHYGASLGPGAGLLIYNINTAQWIAAGAVLVVFLLIGWRARQIGAGAPRGSGFNLLEALVQYVRDDMVYAVMGRERGRRFVPLFLTQFVFILFMNLLGLIPFFGAWGGTATGNLAVTGGLALTTLLWIHMSGVREHGFFHHWKNFVPHGVPWWVLIIIIPVEILGMLVKPFALTIRLFANMTAGHLVMLSFFGLVYLAGSLMLGIPALLSLGFAIGIGCLELFVALVQAYIFTYLSVVFVGASVHPEH